MTESNTPPSESTPPPPPPGDSVPPPPVGYESSIAAPETNKDARLWGMLAHLTALSGFIGVPLGNFIGPLIIWLIKKNDIPFVDDQGKESLNFQITMLIAAFASALLICVGIGIVLLIAVGIVDLVFIIIASVKANAGERYRYPFTLRLIK